MKKSILIIFLFAASLQLSKAQTTKTDTLVYTSVEELPEFPGGPEKFKEYVSAGIKKAPPKDAASGMVIITFVIEKNGEITGTHVTKGLTSETDSLALNIIGKSPKWKPASQSGKIVRCKYSVPVSFGKGNDFTIPVKEIRE